MNLSKSSQISTRIHKHLRRFSTKIKWTPPPTGFDTGIKIYNCVAREKVPLILRNKSYSSFYTCGPTVYDSAHIGHASCYVKLDIMQRILSQHFKINLVTAMNITDIDDKIIKRSQQLGKGWKELAEHYEKEFWDDLQQLNVKLPDIRIKVTDHIPQIINFISKLIENNSAYTTSNGSVNFRTQEFSRYGKLQKLSFDTKEGEKQANADFALWKGSKPDEPYWAAEFGKGRPAWHIECSTLASLLFGSEIDFHAGGLDLRFPHHENEEAQSCCYHNVDDWVKYWIHTGNLNLEEQTAKMSKSLKNTISIAELLQKYSPDEFRMFCLLSNYRSSLEFSSNSMALAINVSKKFATFFNDVEAYVGGHRASVEINTSEIMEKLKEIEVRIDESLRDDFNTSKAISSLLDLASSTSKIINNQQTGLIQASTYGPVQSVSNFIKNQLEIFGMSTVEKRATASSTDSCDVESIINNVINTRNSIRQKAMDTKDKDLFKVCDELRDCLKRSNVELKDHGKNSTWHFIK